MRLLSNKNKIIGLLLLLNFISTYSKTNYSGVHESQIEISESDYEGISDMTLIPAKGKVNYYNNDIKFDGNFKYKIASSDNSEYNDTMKYSAVGGLWQYNGIANATLGIKGALDYDYMFVSKDSYYTRLEKEDYLVRSGNLQSEDSFGIKFYANKYFKIGSKITTGFWNEYAVTKIEKSSYNKIINYPNNPMQVDTDNSYLTVTPRVIYVEEWGVLKFVGEAYVDVRKYFKGVVDLNGKEKDFFYKTILNPQIIYNKETEKYSVFVYSNYENEKMMTIDFWQQTFKVTPRFEYRATPKLKVGATGAGYEKQEEIGINFDNKELFANKQADTYSSTIFALRLYAEYIFTDQWSVGNEIISRSGKWEDKKLNEYLNEEHNIFYVKYANKYSEKGEVELKNSYEIYRNENDLIDNRAPLEENMYRITGTWRYYL